VRKGGGEWLVASTRDGAGEEAKEREEGKEVEEGKEAEENRVRGLLRREK
jgi:hypothetical protein